MYYFNCYLFHKKKGYNLINISDLPTLLRVAETVSCIFMQTNSWDFIKKQQLVRAQHRDGWAKGLILAEGLYLHFLQLLLAGYSLNKCIEFTPKISIYKSETFNIYNNQAINIRMICGWHPYALLENVWQPGNVIKKTLQAGNVLNLSWNICHHTGMLHNYLLA
jgi:hypothetical protein